MRSLITGVNGFAGSHLADHLLADGDAEIWGCDLSIARRPYVSARVQLLAADLRDPEATRQAIAAAQPERIYHLAGQAFVGDSWARPWETIESNLRSQVNLLEAVVACGLQPRILIVGSAEEYGRTSVASVPIDETRELRPDSPYSLSKVAQDMSGLQYFLSAGLPIIRVRPFNHIGPRQSHKFVAAAFASQIAAIEAGLQPAVMRVGNLEARRDFTDVRDTVRAYALLLERGQAGEVYNIGSGESRQIKDLLRIMLSLARLTIHVETDTSRLRPNDLPDLVCDASRLRAVTGWRPSFTIEQSLRDLLDYERTLVVPALTQGR